ncbi:hypothetical protein OG976_22945 [Mycobacterium sp. NBC_00419]|uniref:hypothetical protein n=1 Tax=Mycobacterium sp. NBC_00419 TaxID=2975989 RepID=UPI002E20B274
MTFAIAEVLSDAAGRVTLLADTKLTDRLDDVATRHIYTHPCLKIVIIDDDIAVAVAGDNPESALRFVTSLRGQGLAQIVESLRRYSVDHDSRNVSKSFLIAKRAPNPKLWRIVRGQVDDSSALPRLWIGDPAAFSAFQSQHHSALPSATAEFRLVAAMQAISAFDDIATVGGYITRLTGDGLHPFRFAGDQTRMAPWLTQGTVDDQNGRTALTFSVPPGADPTRHSRIAVPGHGRTPGALAFVIPEIGTARMWTHEAPWLPPIKLSGLRAMDDLLRAASNDHGQLLRPN